MTGTMTGCDVVELARKIEETGCGAYLTMKENTKDPAMISLLDYLAGEETGHVAIFEAMGRDMSCQAERMFTPSPDDQAYVQVILKSGLFDDPKAGLARARTARTPLEVLRFAMQFERDAMLFWMKLFQMVKEPDRAVIGRLIREEEKHIREIDHLLIYHQETAHGAIEI